MAFCHILQDKILRSLLAVIFFIVFRSRTKKLFRDLQYIIKLIRHSVLQHFLQNAHFKSGVFIFFLLICLRRIQDIDRPGFIVFSILFKQWFILRIAGFAVHFLSDKISASCRLPVGLIPRQILHAAHLSRHIPGQHHRENKTGYAENLQNQRRHFSKSGIQLYLSFFFHYCRSFLYPGYWIFSTL